MFKALPKTLKINGNTWKVKVTCLSSLLGNDEALGVTVFDPLEGVREILIDSSVKKEHQKLRVLYHEIMHAIIYESKLPNGSICQTAEEVVCETFADFLHSLLSGNTKKKKSKN